MSVHDGRWTLSSADKTDIIFNTTVPEGVNLLVTVTKTTAGHISVLYVLSAIGDLAINMPNHEESHTFAGNGIKEIKIQYKDGNPSGTYLISIY